MVAAGSPGGKRGVVEVWGVARVSSEASLFGRNITDEENLEGGIDFNVSLGG